MPLSVTIVRVTINPPNIALHIANILPYGLHGTRSPKPTVVIQMTV